MNLNQLVLFRESPKYYVRAHLIRESPKSRVHVTQQSGESKSPHWVWESPKSRAPVPQQNGKSTLPHQSTGRARPPADLAHPRKLGKLSHGHLLIRCPHIWIIYCLFERASCLRDRPHVSLLGMHRSNALAVFDD